MTSIEELHNIGYFSGLDYHFARAIARLGEEGNPLALLAAALVSRFTRQGHVCLDLSAVAGTPVITESQETLEGSRWPKLEKWLAAVSDSRLVAKEDVSAPLVLDRGDRLYLARYWQYQQRFLEQLRTRSEAEVDGVDHELLAAGLDRLFPGIKETPDGQRIAAETSVKRHLTVVSGGPGTGKTYTVVKMLQLIIEQALSAGNAPLRILLSAPTGKAAARLKASVAAAKASGAASEDTTARKIMEMVPDEAATIHRLLGYGFGNAMGSGGNAENYLPVDVLVVDEASMVDLSLMTRLMEALPQKARLILLGDKDQLASVEAGAILGDICRGDSVGHMEPQPPIARSVVSLTRSFRFDSGGGIGILAGAIRDGDSNRALSCLLDEKCPDVIFRSLPSAGALTGKLKDMARREYLPYFSETNPSRKIAAFNAFRILCAHRHGPFGVDMINDVVEAFLLDETRMAPGRLWYPGRPVMVIRNDYHLGLFNGDIGMVMPGEGGDGLKVYFEEKGDVRWITPSRMPAHTTVYATTVHKSQGSEFDDIVLILPPHRSPVVTRELLYTAVTRARKRVEIIGPEKVVREAIETPVQRASGISEQLYGGFI